MIERFPECKTRVMGDFNVDTSSGIVQKIREQNNLANMTQVYGRDEIQYLPTYKRGNKQIDFSLASWEILQEIENVDYLPYEENSDHRELVFTVRWEKNKLPANRSRGIQSKQFRRALKFRSAS